MNPKYFSNYTIKQYIDENGNSRLFVWFVVKANLTNILASGVLKGKLLGVNQFSELFKGSVDFCNFSNNFVGKTFIKFYEHLWNNYGNYTPGCPMLINSYYIDIPLSEIILPPYVPKTSGEFIITATSKMRIAGKRSVKLWDGVVTSSVTV
jgi:Protein of unknown function (DUF1091)